MFEACLRLDMNESYNGTVVQSKARQWRKVAGELR